jgi:hypothetical protein
MPVRSIETRLMSKFYALSPEMMAAQIFEKKAPANRGFGGGVTQTCRGPSSWETNSLLSHDKQFRHVN